MSAEKAIRAIRAIESLSRLMDLYDAYDYEEDNWCAKRRKVVVKNDDMVNALLKDIAWNDGEDLFCPFSMDNFEDLCNMVSLKYERRIMLSCSVKMRVAITLRYLVTGESFSKISKICQVSRKYILKFVPEVMQFLIEGLEKDYLKLPKTKSEWINTAKDFEEFWEFPHILGVFELRNFAVRLPNNLEGSLILLAVLDAHSRFCHIEFLDGDELGHSNAYIRSQLYECLTEQTLNIPRDEPLKGQDSKTPYLFVGSEIFGMDPYTLNAYDETSKLTRSEKAFNYRINRVRFPVQMAFEIMYYRFKIFQRLRDIKAEKAKLIFKTCCLLHNFLTQTLTTTIDHSEEPVGVSCTSMRPISKQSYELNKNAREIRENFCNYCVSEGNIAEQWEKILKKEEILAN